MCPIAHRFFRGKELRRRALEMFGFPEAFIATSHLMAARDRTHSALVTIERLQESLLTLAAPHFLRPPDLLCEHADVQRAGRLILVNILTFGLVALNEILAAPSETVRSTETDQNRFGYYLAPELPPLTSAHVISYDETGASDTAPQLLFVQITLKSGVPPMLVKTLALGSESLERFPYGCIELSLQGLGPAGRTNVQYSSSFTGSVPPPCPTLSRLTCITIYLI